MSALPALPDLLSSYVGFLRFVTGPASTGIGGGALPVPDMHLAIVALLTGFAVLVHADLADSPEEPASPIDQLSLIVITVVTVLCLLVSIWAVASGVDLDTVVF